ncbi:hypothetical protein AGLY_010728 [Aphis glycines]|uniref:Uncharacterized protein n=1 Tax=Aphis glycines TaxID=307491 RepID=A0A6G0TED6_APHGL|nr:hypothetical protein AGLY_010728 [Aphis glycines]
MSDGINNNLNLFLIKKILSEILIPDNQNNINDPKSSSKHNNSVNFSDKTQVDENSVFTKMDYEWDDFEDEHEMMYIIENKSFIENKISEKEIKGTTHPTASLVKNYSFITRCTKQRPMVCYDYLCKTRSPSFKRVELLTPVKEKKWFEDYKMELQFLQENFSEVLPEILYDVVRKGVTDPVHYIVHYLIKYKVDNLKNDNT